jgi:hypothetical protein
MTNSKLEETCQVTLMTHVIETYDPVTYSDIKGQTEWEHAMKTEIDSFSKKKTGT